MENKNQVHTSFLRRVPHGRQMPQPFSNPMFDSIALKRLIVPLIIEQILAVTVGMADIMMVSQAGQYATSGVSLVDTISTLLIQVFSALATGGAVISSHYLGKGKTSDACRAANQLVLSVGFMGFFIMLLSLIGNRWILTTIYGHVDTSVMDAAETYFFITACSYPFLAIYNGCAALCRSMGDSKISMKTSILMNIINVAGNALLVLVFHLGVIGVAIPTLISRIVAASVMLLVIHNQKRPIHIDAHFRLGFDWKLIKEILGIGIPTGLDGSLFQIGKLLVASLVSTFGTASIAANAVGNTLASFEVIPGSAIGLAMITVVGQTLGANEQEQAKYYTKKLMKIIYISMGLLNLVLIFLCDPILTLYNLEPDAFSMARFVVLLHGICGVFLWPIAFALPNALRAGGDARFIMFISIISMWTFRIGFSYLLGQFFQLGLAGVWIAMVIDWVCRSTFFVWRFQNGKWIHKLE